MAQTGVRRSESSDEIGEDNSQEMELIRLKKQLRVMEVDRAAYVEDSSNIIRKQEAEIESLLRENEEIQTILRLVQSEKNEGMDADNAARLCQIIEELDAYNKEVDNEKTMISTLDKQEVDNEKTMISPLDKQILTVERQIHKERKKTTGQRVRSASSNMPISKRLHVMENRLHKATVQFNQQLAYNAKLRGELDNLRQEKTIFDSLYKRLSREFDELKKQKMLVIQEATQAYEERYEAQSKMVTLQERCEKDQIQNDSEMKELQRVIHQDNKLKEFMIAKAHDRAALKAEEEAKKKRGHEHERNHTADKQMIETYEEAFMMIKDITGEDDLENIVDNFIHKEDENFALFNYVNELNEETEKLQEEVTMVKKNIITFREENIKLNDERKIFLKDIEMRTNKAEAEGEVFERKQLEVRKVLEELKSGIASLFKTIDCDPAQLRDMLGSVDEVMDKNVMQYLGVVEQRALELLHVHQYIDMKSKRGVPPAQTPTTPPPEDHARAPASASRAPSIMPPSLGPGDEFSDDETDDMSSRPFTREELSQIVVQHISRRPLVSATPSTSPGRRSGMKGEKKGKLKSGSKPKCPQP